MSKQYVVIPLDIFKEGFYETVKLEALECLGARLSEYENQLYKYTHGKEWEDFLQQEFEEALTYFQTINVGKEDKLLCLNSTS